MIVLDTNTLSETMKPAPSDIVLHWLSQQGRESVFTTVITQAEMFYGIERLAEGKRRQLLSAMADRLFGERGFQGRILTFDQEPARLFAKIVAAREALGRPISQFDAMIAAIARSHGATLATRNTSDFDHCGIRLINPWTP
jgi:hypothetical protein